MTLLRTLYWRFLVDGIELGLGGGQLGGELVDFLFVVFDVLFEVFLFALRREAALVDGDVVVAGAGIEIGLDGAVGGVGLGQLHRQPDLFGGDSWRGLPPGPCGP